MAFLHIDSPSNKLSYISFDVSAMDYWDSKIKKYSIFLIFYDFQAPPPIKDERHF